MQEVEEIQEKILKDDAHVMHMWKPLPEIEIGEEFEFVSHSYLFRVASFLLYSIAYPLLWIWNKTWYGFSVTGKDNIEKIKNGKITVSNHIHTMDCTMNAILNAPNKMYFPTLKSNFQIPVVNIIIKLLNAIPIPDKIQATGRFIEEITTLLQKGETVHFYPEGSLRPYETRIRNFKSGAFRLAVENNVPIIPIVYTFLKVTGLRKIIRKKPLIYATILEPIYPEKVGSIQAKIKQIQQETWNKMNQVANQRVERK